MSNMSVREWYDSMVRSLDAIKTYIKEIGITRSDIETSINTIDDAIKGIDPDVKSSSPEVVFALADALDINTSRISDLATWIRNPYTLQELIRGMSRSYSDNIQSRRRDVRIRVGNMMKIERYIADTITYKFDDKRALIAAYEGSLKTPVTTGIYVRALMVFGDLVEIDAVKDSALGVVDAHTRHTPVHPTQLLSSFVPMLTASSASNPVSLVLPTANLDIKYNIKPLISKTTATNIHGLNYKLVESLRTIAGTPIMTRTAQPSAAAHGVDSVPSAPWVDGQPLDSIAVKMGGESYTLTPANKVKWSPDKGISARVTQYSKLCENIIMEQLEADSKFGWDAEIKKRYEAAMMDNPTGTCSADGIINEITQAFEERYDLSPPETAIEFKEMMLPPYVNNYICSAIGKIQSEILANTWRYMLARPTGRRVPVDASMKEAKASMLISVTSTSAIMLRRIKNASKISFDEYFEIKDPSNRKTRLMKEFRRIVTIAANAEPIPCLPLSLKIYAATESKFEVY